MTITNPMFPPARRLRLVHSQASIPTNKRSRTNDEQLDAAEAAACMGRLLRVVALMRRLSDAGAMEADFDAADRALVYFATIAEGFPEQAGDESVVLDFLRDHPSFTDFVLVGDIDALICATAVYQLAPAAQQIEPATAEADDPIFNAIAGHETTMAILRGAIRRQDTLPIHRDDVLVGSAIEAETAAAKALVSTVPTSVAGLLAVLAHVENFRRVADGNVSIFCDWVDPVLLRSAGAAAISLTEANRGQS